MQHALRRLAKRLVGYRRHIPAPVYEALRQAYHKAGALPFMQVPDTFDTAFYVQTAPKDALRNLQPYAHFIRYGQQELRNPSPNFDIVWYLHNYGHTFDANKIEPFSHYLKIGKDAGNTPHPPRQVKFNKDTSLPLESQPRRACLFAAYDPDECVDDYVIIYLKELARHADIFYLADCEMPASELAKLKGIVKGAWAAHHGAYDFGSYRNLARDFVGWDRLSTYDEVIFANDSCYLVKPLDDVFAQMAAKPCAWWGLQATKGLISTIEAQPFPGAEDAIHIDIVKSKHLNQFERDPIYDFHIGSYFMVFRKDIMKDLRFQRVINAIKPEVRKLNIIKKYEVGLTRFLIGLGYEFSTYGSMLTRKHPVYTEVVFDLIQAGFPFLKRFMLSENHYKISALAYWKSVLRQAGTVTPIALIEGNYLRTSNADKVYHGLHVLEDGIPATRPMADAEFVDYDRAAPKYGHYWGFLVCSSDQTLPDTTKAIFESVKDDATVVKVVFTTERHVSLTGRNLIIVPLESREGQTYLARCGNLFVQHGQEKMLVWTVDDARRTVHAEPASRPIEDVPDTNALHDCWRDPSIKKIKNSVIFLQAESTETADQDRISVLASQLLDQGWNSRTVDVDAVSIELLVEAEFVVFCALEMSPQTLDLAEGIKATGGKVIYDLDALVHDETVFMDSRYFMRDPKLANRLRLQSHHKAQLMMLADGFTVTTPTLLSSVRAFDKPAAIVMQCMSPSSIQEYGQLPRTHSNDQIHLSYIIDPRVHAGDFAECAAAVIDLMRERSNIVLHIIGGMNVTEVDIPRDLDERIHRHGTMPQAAMHALLRTMDINLAPLSDTVFNDALSAVRVLEAALHAVPTIASPSESHCNAIVDRRTGYLARTHQDWQFALHEAVDNLDVCRDIGQAARRSIIPDFTADVAVKQFTGFLTNTW